MTVASVAAVVLVVVLVSCTAVQWRFRRYQRRERLAPLESRAARDAVRTVVERRR
jgi:hypothetical protein